MSLTTPPLEQRRCKVDQSQAALTDLEDCAVDDVMQRRHVWSMPGKEARDGFWFQDAKALTRLLDDALERRRRRLLGLDLGPELRVRVESVVQIVVDTEPEHAAAETPRPTWDGTFSIGDRVVVDECKLGGPTRDDRVTLYRRLRATIVDDVAVDRLAPRLTVGRDSLANPEKWRRLAEFAQTTVPAGEPLGHADNAERLAAEALYYLTTAEPIWKLKKQVGSETESESKRECNVPPTPPLSLENARALLSRFEFDDSTSIDEVEARLRAQLEAVGAQLAVDELIKLLRGWVDDEARARDWRADLTADSLTTQLSLVARYMDVSPPIEALWRRLRESVPSLPASVLPVQSWRDVQPNVVDVVRDRMAKRVVFTSDGGVGKSFLLATLHAEQTGSRVWIDTAAPLQDIEQALALGAWATQRSGVELTVFIDAVDQVADSAALLATVDRALTASAHSSVFVAMRFATWAETRDRLPGWRAVRLERWSNERIRTLVEVGRTEPLSADLIELLRTPLLLELFRRTFAASDVVPPGLATRHGVLRAYFQWRVLPDADITATDRRLVLDAGVAAVLRNTAAWRDSTPAARQLISEGVVTSPFGELRFRHALLRDFAAALHLVPQTAEQIAHALRGVESPIARNELLRGVIEAQLDPDPVFGGPSVADVAGACSRVGLASGIALGTTDAPTAQLLAAIAPLEDGAVLRQAIAHARLIDNRAWLRVPSALGGARPAWLHTTQLEAMSRLAEFAVVTRDAASASLATTLRAWTWGHAVGDEGPWSIAMIGRLLASVLIDDTTIGWYENLELGANQDVSRFLEQLRDLAADQRLDEALLSRALHKLFFAGGSRHVHEGYALWEVVHLCLMDHGDTSGLLVTRPALGLALLFALSVARQEADDHRRRAERSERAFAAEPEEAIGNLIDDAPVSDDPALDEVDALMNEVTTRAAEEGAFADALANAAVTSRSVHARIIVLGLRGSDRVEEVVLEILRDSRIYHFLFATHAVWDAIKSRWADLDPETRAIVQQNILNRARSPRLGVTWVGRLASSVPRADLIPELVSYLEFLETSGRSTEPPRTSTSRAFSSEVDDDHEYEILDGTRPEIAASWHRLCELAAIENDVSVATEAIEVFRQQLASGHLGDDTPDWAWSAVRRIIDRDERRNADRVISPEDAAAVFELALHAAAIEANRSYEDRWSTLLDIADACPSYVSSEAVGEMRARIIAEVVAGAGDRAERQRHAWLALVRVRSATWLDDRSGGRAIFESWFRHYLHGVSLRVALRFLSGFVRDTRVELLRHVLETDQRLAQGETRSIVNEAGRFMATWSIGWEQSWARDLVQRWCDAKQRPSVLADQNNWRVFLSGFARNLQNAVRHVTNDPRSAADLRRFVPLMTIAWSAWSQVVIDDVEGHPTVGWSVVAPLSKQYTTSGTDPAVPKLTLPARQN